MDHLQLLNAEDFSLHLDINTVSAKTKLDRERFDGT